MFANDMLGIATDLIKEFGDDAILVEVQMGDYNPATGEKDNIYIDHIIKVIQENTKDIRIAGDEGYRNQIINNSDVKFSFVTDLDVDSSMFIKYGGVEYEIFNASPITTQNTTVLWEVFAKS
jgi:hypothetical protein